MPRHHHHHHKHHKDRHGGAAAAADRRGGGSANANQPPQLLQPTGLRPFHTQCRFFWVAADVDVGGCVRVVGNHPALGMWNVDAGHELVSRDDTQPCWFSPHPVELPLCQPIEYKYVIVDASREGYVFEGGDNRVVVPQGPELAVEDDDGLYRTMQAAAADAVFQLGGIGLPNGGTAAAAAAGLPLATTDMQETTAGMSTNESATPNAFHTLNQMQNAVGGGLGLAGSGMVGATGAAATGAAAAAAASPLAPPLPTDVVLAPTQVERIDAEVESEQVKEESPKGESDLTGFKRKSRTESLNNYEGKKWRVVPSKHSTFYNLHYLRHKFGVPPPRQQQHGNATTHEETIINTAQKSEGERTTTDMGDQKHVKSLQPSRLKFYGWPGVHAASEAEREEIRAELEPFDCVPVFFNDSSEFDKYLLLCRTFLWPIIHNQLPSDLSWRGEETSSNAQQNVFANWDTDLWNCYVRINEEFARQVVTHHKSTLVATAASAAGVSAQGQVQGGGGGRRRGEQSVDTSPAATAAVVESHGQGAPNNSAAVTPKQLQTLYWVNDYPLWLVGATLKKLHREASIGLFLHTPFPTSEIFVCLPPRAEILKGLLSCDLLGFQFFDYTRHFLTICKRLYKGRGGGVESTFRAGGFLALELADEGREVQIRVGHACLEYPLVRDQLLLDKRVHDRARELRRKFEGKMIIAGCDRLASLSGLVIKLKCFDNFLERYDHHRGRIVLLQIGFTKTTYSSSAQVKALIADINQEVLQINEKHGPHVHLINGEIPSYEKQALLMAADVFLDTSLKDGLNLMPFEYYAARSINVLEPTDVAPAAASLANIMAAAPPTVSQAVEYPQSRALLGRVICSEFSGCSHALVGSLRVNPWDINGVASALDEAINMPIAELQARFVQDASYVASLSLLRWAEDFCVDLIRAGKVRRDLEMQAWYGGGRAKPSNLIRRMGLDKNFQQLKAEDVCRAYMESTGLRVFFLDTEGTLAPDKRRLYRNYTGINDDHLASRGLAPADKVLRHLATLLEDPRNVIVIMSGRSRRVLSSWFDKKVPGIGLAAEHGYYYRVPLLSVPAFSPSPLATDPSLVSAAAGGSPKSAAAAAAAAAVSFTPSALDRTVSNKGKWERLLQIAETGEHDSGEHAAAKKQGSDKSGINPQQPFSSLPVAAGPNATGCNEPTPGWKKIALLLMTQYVSRTQNTFIENKGSALVWQYRDADPEIGAPQAAELVTALEDNLAYFHEVEVTSGKGYVEVRLQGVNKGVAVQEILYKIQKATGSKPDFVLCCGDDRSDEHMFEALLPQRLNAERWASTAAGMSAGHSATAAAAAATGVKGEAPLNEREPYLYVSREQTQNQQQQPLSTSPHAPLAAYGRSSSFVAAVTDDFDDRADIGPGSRGASATTGAAGAVVAADEQEEVSRGREHPIALSRILCTRSFDDVELNTHSPEAQQADLSRQSAPQAGGAAAAERKENSDPPSRVAVGDAGSLLVPDVAGAPATAGVGLASGMSAESDAAGSITPQPPNNRSKRLPGASAAFMRTFARSQSNKIFTVTVGRKASAASYFVRDVNAVSSLLRSLSELVHNPGYGGGGPGYSASRAAAGRGGGAGREAVAAANATAGASFPPKGMSLPTHRMDQMLFDLPSAEEYSYGEDDDSHGAGPGQNDDLL